MRSFADLKKNREENFNRVASNLKNDGRDAEDPRFWKPSTDKAGNGSALIRFLPPPPGEDQPFVKLYTHWFKGPTGQWYVENCRTTIGETDPCNDYNNQLWALETESSRKQASDQKRQTNYITNVLVLDDPANPANNGQVKLYKFGPMIFEMIKSKMTPEFADQKPLDVFDFWNGANFRIRIRKDGAGYPKPDRSEFETPGPLFSDDDQLEAVWNQQHSLQAFIASDQFKSYDELKRRLNTVLGLNSPTPVESRQTASIPDASAPQPKAEEPAVRPSAENVSADEDDDNLDYFARLAQGDD